MKIYNPVFIIICLFICINTFAQKSQDESDLIATTFKSVFQDYSKEEIFLQTDRQLYIAGEKIWFKAFVVNSYSQKIRLDSKNLFADLVNDSDVVISRLVLDNQKLKTDGVFTIPDTIRTGMYWLRCYTAKMLQQPQDMFIQPIYILNKNLHDANSYSTGYAATLRKINKSAVIQFYPERLSGIPAIISTGVIKITDANNNPLTVHGTLVNNNDSVITTFTTNNLGLARITFLDEPSLQYTAIVSVNGNKVRYQLPSVNQKAAQISIANQAAEKLKAFVTLENDLPSNLKTVIIGINKDSLCYAAVGSGTYGTVVPLQNFPGGISTLLLFDSNKKLLDQRSIYIDKDNSSLEVLPNKQSYTSRENVIMNMKASADNTEALPSSFSVSVQDAWLVQLADSITSDEEPPQNKLLLEDWITVHKAKLSAEDIDLILVASKLSATENNSATDASLHQYDDNDKILNLVGRITNNRKDPLKDRTVTVMSKSDGYFFLDTATTKNDGLFKIPLPQNTDSLSISLSVIDKHDIQRPGDSVSIDNFIFPVVATPFNLKKQFFAYNLNLLNTVRKYHIDTSITFQGKGWLAPVIVSAAQKPVLNYDESKRINAISQILTHDKFRYGGAKAITNALLAVPGVSVIQNHISIFGIPIMSFYQNRIEDPLLIVDGVEVGYATIKYFDELNPADIDFIEVLRGGEAGIYGIRAASGVISVNTRKGADRYQSENNFRVFNPVIYHSCPPFYMPDYSNDSIRNSKSTDPRTTIYWNGNIVTNEKGEASFHFFTSDNAGKYAVTISGLSEKGDLIYKRVYINGE